MTHRDWKQSFPCVVKALEYCGFELAMTEEEFNALPIPESEDGRKHYYQRCVNVQRGDEILCARINNILAGGSKLLTRAEMGVIHTRRKVNSKRRFPKGTPSLHMIESATYMKLRQCLELDDSLLSTTLWEGRLADVAVCHIHCAQHMLTARVHVGIQIKTSHVQPNGRVNFTVSLQDIVNKYLCHGIIVMCIAYRDDCVVTVWIFDQADIPTLQLTSSTSSWSPRVNSSNTILHDDKIKFQMDDTQARARCKKTLVDKVHTAEKRTLQYFNEDACQIPCASYRIELQSFIVHRNIAQQNSVMWERRQEFDYTSIDYVLRYSDGVEAYIQDKATTKTKGQFNMRRTYGLPYDPDVLSVFQVTDLCRDIVYAFPLRVQNHDTIISFFDEAELMRPNYKMTMSWKDKYAAHAYRLSDATDMARYVQACHDAACVSALSDTAWYGNMLKEYADEFVK